MAQTYEVTVRQSVEFAVHDGVKLVGDLYVPQLTNGRDKAPVMVGVHGGGWQQGDRSLYKYWGPFLAQHGIALFAIEYRLSKPDKATYPQAVHDVRAAVQFVRGRAGELGLDPDRIGLQGDSAGGHLASLVGLAGDSELFAGAYRDDAHASASTRVKAVVSVYGVYDLAAQWNHDLSPRPRESITTKFLGKHLYDDRRIYFDASPLSHVTTRMNATSFYLAWGTEDDIVDPATQAVPFRDALKQAGYFVRTATVPGAPHFWSSEPIDAPSSYSGFVAPRVLRFLQEKL
jgi:acetyl esterase/lipase